MGRDMLMKTVVTFVSRSGESGIRSSHLATYSRAK